MSLQPRTEPVHDELALIPFVHRVPPEILSEIFIACLPNIEFPVPSPHTAPMLVAQVCGHWRRVSLTTPALWCSMHFITRGRGIQSNTPFFTTLLERSGNLSLSLCFSLDYWNSYDHPSPQVLEAVIPYAHRLENITFHLSAISWRSLAELKGRLPHLRKLTASTTKPELFRNNPFDGFSEAPKLNEVALQFPVAGMNLPWTQISGFTFSHQRDFQACVNALHKAIEIDYCAFEDCRFRGAPAFPFTLSLRSLRIFRTIGLFRYINVPMAQEIILERMHVPHMQLLQMFERSSCSLKKLILLDMVSISQIEVIEYLEMLSSLVELQIEWPRQRRDSCLDSGFVDLLTQKGDEQPLAPNLRVLKLGLALARDGHAFADMVESRWHVRSPSNVTRLESVRVSSLKEPSPTASTRLKLFRDQGLELEVLIKDLAPISTPPHIETLSICTQKQT